MKRFIRFGPFLILILAVYLVGLRIYQNRTVTIIPPNRIEEKIDEKSPKTEMEEKAELDLINDKININSATESELMLLDGIGEKTASKIVQKRKEIGKFKSIEQIIEIDGIGYKMFQEIKNYITVE